MSAPLTGTPPTYPVAELDRRFYAFAVDRLIVWGVYAATAVACWYFLGGSGFWASASIVVGVAVLMTLVLSAVLGKTGSSPGKSLVGLRVVHHGTGTPIGFARALLRSLVLGLSALPTFGLGLATLAWTAVADGGHRRRGWHDHLSHGIVVDVRPAPPVAAEVEAPRHVVNLTAMRLIPASPPAPPAPAQQAGPAARIPDAGSTSHRAPQPLPQQPPMQQPLQPPLQQPGQPAPAWPQHPTRQPAPPQTPPQTAPQPGQGALHRAPQPDEAQAPQAPHPPADDGRTVVRAARQSTQQPNVAPQQAPVPSVRWRVTFDDGETFVVEGLALVGRRPEPRGGEPVRHVVPLSSGDMSLSKTHAQFAPAPDGALVVMDRGSTNGSMLLRKGVARELTAGKPATVIDGDTVRFGDREMVVSRER